VNAPPAAGDRVSGTAEEAPVAISSVRGDAWLLLAFGLPAVAALLALVPVNDLAYLVRAGDIMLTDRSILRTDPFTFTMGGRPWLDQQWAAAIAFGWLFRAFGWAGIVFLRALFLSVAVGATYLRTRRGNGDPLVSGCLVLGAFVVAAAVPGTLAVRPQLLVLPLFVASGWLIAGRSQHPGRAWFLVPIVVLWASLHGSFVLVPMMLVIAVVDDLISRRSTLLTTSLALLACLVAPVVSPFGAGTYQYVWEVATSPVIRHVVDEWRPLWAQFPAWLLFLVVNAAAILITLRRRARMPTVEEGLTMLLFTGLAVWSGRNAVWWMLAVPPIVGGLIRGWHPSGAPSRSLPVVIAATLAVLLLAAGTRVVTTHPPEALLAEAPAGITQAVAAVAQPDARVWDGRWGSWFEFSLPSTEMFVDPRVELFPDPVWSDFFRVADAAPGWQDTLDRWEVDVVVASADRDARLLAAIGTDPGWRPVYQDGEGGVYVRT
jgi:hypothetical protein